MKPTPLMQHNYAPYGRRALAFLLDNLVFSMLPLIFLTHGSTRAQIVTLSVWILIAATIFEGVKGWSFGRWATRTRLVDMHTGKHIGVVRDIVRTQLHATELILFPISYLRPLWNEHRLTFGDAICSTVVIYVPKETKAGWKQISAPLHTGAMSEAA